MAIRLPSYIPPSAKLNRPEAGKLNELKTQSQDITFSGYNEVVPVVYGEQIVAGPIIAGPPTGAVTSLRYAIAITYVGDAPVEGITHVIVNGVKHVASAIPSDNSPAVFAKEGISFRIYNGMQTIVDSTLKTTFGTSFNDTFNGVAYAVITIPQNQSASIEFDSAVKFVVRGKKCLDPRDNVRRWTENPSLHLFDYITDSNLLGRSAEGIVDCANWNDSLYSGLPRARTGLTINAALKTEDILDLMCTYAECLWSYEGESVRAIPDKPIDGAADVIDVKQIKKGALTFTGSNQDQIPTAVAIFFSDRDVEGEWGSLPARAQIAEHEVYGTVSSLSDVQMPGIYRRIEADRRAWQRLMRLQSPGKIAWQMYAVGIQYQAGDVVRLPDVQGLNSMRVRLISQPEMVAAGIYQMHGEPYKADDYPQGREGAVVPVGGVVFLSEGAAVPQGFEEISPDAALPICGTGLGSATGEIAHSGQIPTGGISFTCSPAGAHSTTSGNGVVVSTSGDGPVQKKQDTPVGNHSHTGSIQFSWFANSNGVSKRSARLIVNNSSSAPANISGFSFLAVEELPQEGIVEKDPKLGYFISTAKAFTETVGIKRTAASTTLAGGHTHESQVYPQYRAVRGDFNNFVLDDHHDSRDHHHSVPVGVEQTLKAKRVAQYAFAGESLMPKGSIIGFIGSTVPPGWALCDGTNGTPDLVDYFLDPSYSLDAGTSHGVNHLKITFESPGAVGASHRHRYKTSRGFYQVAKIYSHDNYVSHTHSINVGWQVHDFNYKPPHFALTFIQYKGD